MDSSLIFQQLKLTETNSLESIVMMIKQIATLISQDFNLPKECKESLIEDLPMKVFKQWFQYQPKYKLESWIYSIAHKEALSSLPYYQKAKNCRSARKKLSKCAAKIALKAQEDNVDKALDKLMAFLTKQFAHYAEEHAIALGELHNISQYMHASRFTARLFITDDTFNNVRLIEDWFYQFGIWDYSVSHVLSDGFNLEDFEDIHRVWDVEFSIPDPMVNPQDHQKDLNNPIDDDTW